VGKGDDLLAGIETAWRGKVGAPPRVGAHQLSWSVRV
jgi:hypothetical protein